MAKTGPERVIACLDRQEFLDPQAFGEPATLAGIVCGSEGSAAAALAQLFHPRCRGGGDLSEFARAGGWRNGRLIVSSPEPSAAGLPTTAEIRSRFTDISKPMKRFLKKEFG